jgi:hypothetical protein
LTGDLETVPPPARKGAVGTQEESSASREGRGFSEMKK